MRRRTHHSAGRVSRHEPVNSAAAGSRVHVYAEHRRAAARHPRAQRTGIFNRADGAVDIRTHPAGNRLQYIAQCLTERTHIALGECLLRRLVVRSVLRFDAFLVKRTENIAGRKSAAGLEGNQIQRLLHLQPRQSFADALRPLKPAANTERNIRADGQADDAAGPERDGGCQTLNLVLGTVKDGVAADDGDGAGDDPQRGDGGD